MIADKLRKCGQRSKADLQRELEEAERKLKLVGFYGPTGDAVRERDELAAQNAVLRDFLWTIRGGPTSYDIAEIATKAVNLTPPAALAQLGRELRKQGMVEAAEIVIKYAVDLGRQPVNGMRHLIEDGRGEQDEVRRTYRQAILAASEKEKDV